MIFIFTITDLKSFFAENFTFIMETFNRYALGAIIFYFFYQLITKKGEDIWEGLKGDNDKLDFPELVGVVWAFLFVVTITGSILFSFELSLTELALLELVGLHSLGGAAIRDNFKDKIKGYKDKVLKTPSKEPEKSND